MDNRLRAVEVNESPNSSPKRPMKATYKYTSSRGSRNKDSSFSLEDTFGKGKENDNPVSRVNVVSRKKKGGKKAGRVATPRFNS